MASTVVVLVKLFKVKVPSSAFAWKVVGKDIYYNESEQSKDGMIHARSSLAILSPQVGSALIHFILGE